MPCGRTSSTRIRITERDRELEVGRKPVRADLRRDADDEAAHHRAERAAEPAEHDRREHREQQPEAHVPLHALGHAEQDPAECGEGSAADPHHEHDAADVDARRRREVALVGDRADRGAEARALQHEADGDEHDETDAP